MWSTIQTYTIVASAMRTCVTLDNPSILPPIRILVVDDHGIESGDRRQTTRQPRNDAFVRGRSSTALPKSPFERLSARGREVLRRIVAGSSSSDIARELSLSRKTVDTYRGRLMLKLDAPNRSALIRFAIEYQLIAL